MSPCGKVSYSEQAQVFVITSACAVVIALAVALAITQEFRGDELRNQAITRFDPVASGAQGQ